MRGRDNNDQKSFSIVLPVAYEVFQPFFFLFGFFDDEEDGQTKRRKVEPKRRCWEIADEVRTKEQNDRKNENGDRTERGGKRKRRSTKTLEQEDLELERARFWTTSTTRTASIFLTISFSILMAASVLHVVISTDQESPLDDSIRDQSGASEQWDSMPISGIRGDSPWTPLRLATSFSWAVNWFLIIVKLIVFILSSSKAVLAALVRLSLTLNVMY